MSEGTLTQEQIDALLNGGMQSSSEPEPETTTHVVLTDDEKDVIGEAGNIFISTSATSLSKILNKRVQITTPVVSVSNLKQIHAGMQIPYVVLKVKFEKGIVGTNLLLIKTEDASVIADIMMGGQGTNKKQELSEIELSAVSEAMNQMIGSAATSIAQMMSRVVDISSPEVEVWSTLSDVESGDFSGNQEFVKIGFVMSIEGLLETSIMQLYSIETVKEIVEVLTNGLNSQSSEPEKPNDEPETQKETLVAENSRVYIDRELPENMDLLLDVQLDLSVVFGKTRKTINDILKFGTGTVVELDGYVDEPLEIYVNNKLIAYGEVVVVEEKYGIRVTDIVTPQNRLASLM